MNITSLYETDSFLFNVQAGLIPGIQQIRKYGINTDIDVSTSPEDLWDGGGTYQYPTVNEGLYCYSSNENDTTTSVIVEGLVEEGGDWKLKNVEVTLEGTTPVSLGLFIRVFRARISSETQPTGNILITLGNSGATTPDNSILRAQITQGRNSTLMAMYSVPTGYTAFMYRLFGSVSKNKDAEMSWDIRKFGGVFYTTAIVGLYEESKQFELGFEKVPEKSDIKVSAVTENNGTEARDSFHFLLVDNNFIK